MVQDKILCQSRVWKKGQATINIMKIILKGTVGVRNTWGWPFPQQIFSQSEGSYSVVLHSAVSE